MLLIRAVSFKGRPVARELSARFDESGGTIGRGDQSTLVLPDPERYISRTHATIAFQAGGFVITDNGTKNPVLLNGQPLGQGRQKRLASGDRITLGDYVLDVALAAPAGGPAAAAVTPSVTAPAVPGAVRSAVSSAGASAIPSGPSPVPGGARPKDDPLAVFSAQAHAAHDPFADLLGTPSPPSPVPGGPPSGGPIIAQPPAVPSPPGGPLPADLLDILRGAEPRIDQVYDLQPGPRSDPFAPEPVRDASVVASPASDPFAPPGMLMEAEKPSSRPTVPDHGPEIFTPFAPPPATPGAGAGAAMPQDSRAFAGPTGRTESTPEAPGPSAPEAPPPGRAVSGAVEEALLRSFLQGAGIDLGRVKVLTPQMMESIGQVLREAVQGTVELLRARGLTKSEMGADVTMIRPVDNNPLKFSPSAGAALIHLLAPSLPGFMPPLQAMKSAYDDLRAHQVGFLAGMRAALDEVLGRFAPAELERRLSDPTVLDSVLPMNRKAKLWDLFVQRYADVASEAREDFNTALGKAFRSAYDAQVAKLRGEAQ
jgi:type VI secretion system FHA domain protein